jgi:hypothetical protein
MLTLGGLCGMIGAALWFRPSGPIPGTAWAAFVGALVVGNLAEYMLHRFPMHRRWKLTKGFFRNHSILHHRYFTANAMPMERGIDVLYIVHSANVAVFSFGVFASGFALAWLLIGPQEAALAGLGLALYGLWTEVVHLSFHFPDAWMSKPVLRSRTFQWMKRHHQLHHDPRVMRKWNFNVGLPACDLIFGTLAPAKDMRLIVKREPILIEVTGVVPVAPLPSRPKPIPLPELDSIQPVL